MNNKDKIITFAIIILISIGGLLCKGYLSDEVYVLNEEENTSKNTEDTINKNDGAENSSFSNSNEAILMKSLDLDGQTTGNILR